MCCLCVIHLCGLYLQREAGSSIVRGYSLVFSGQWQDLGCPFDTNETSVWHGERWRWIFVYCIHVPTRNGVIFNCIVMTADYSLPAFAVVCVIVTNYGITGLSLVISWLVAERWKGFTVRKSIDSLALRQISERLRRLNRSCRLLWITQLELKGPSSNVRTSVSYRRRHSEQLIPPVLSCAKSCLKQS